MSRSGSRMRRVNQILREAIAEECAVLKDPRIGFLTITDVDTAPDLRKATVFYSVIGDIDVRQETAAALESAASRVRTAVGETVRLKYLPELRFDLDPSIAHGLKITGILSELKKEHYDDSIDPS